MYNGLHICRHWPNWFLCKYFRLPTECQTFAMRLGSYRPRLPPELIDYTIDYLHDSPSTLRTCACVYRAWVAPSRFHLFYRREITPTRTRTVPLQTCKLLEFLQGSPHIAFYIREFHFSV